MSTSCCTMAGRSAATSSPHNSRGCPISTAGLRIRFTVTALPLGARLTRKFLHAIYVAFECLATLGLISHVAALPTERAAHAGNRRFYGLLV